MGISTVLVLCVISFSNNWVRIRRIWLMAFNIEPCKPELVKLYFKHEFWLGLRFNGDSDLQLFGFANLVIFPTWELAFKGAGVPVPLVFLVPLVTLLLDVVREYIRDR